MSEYIERRVAINEIGYIDTSKPWDDKEDIVEKAIAAIDHMPGADVVKVKHGRWEDYKPPYMGMEYSHDTMVCSECEHIMANALRIPAHYCPNCGAKMGGE